jgi:hypothetical protein
MARNGGLVSNSGVPSEGIAQLEVDQIFLRENVRIFVPIELHGRQLRV